jgi:starch synthase (maltosyl-transferring)
VVGGTKHATGTGLRRVYVLNLLRSRRAARDALLSWLETSGFDTLLLSLPPHFGSADIAALPPIVQSAVSSGLRVQLDLRLDIARDGTTVVQRHPDWYQAINRRPADPREAPSPSGLRLLNLRTDAAIESFAEYWVGSLNELSEAGIDGYRCRLNAAVPPAVWRRLIAASPGSRFSAWTPGVAADDLRQLPRGCFNSVYNSLAWWDFGAGWLSDEMTRLLPIAPVANTVGVGGAGASASVPAAARRLLDVAASNGHGLLVPIGFEFGMASDLTCPAFGADDWQRLRDYARLDLSVVLREANRRLATRTPSTAAPRILSSEDAPVAVLFEAPSQLTLANRHLGRPVAFDLAAILPVLDGRLAGFTDATSGATPGASAKAPDAHSLDPIRLAPGEVRVFTGAPVSPIVTTTRRDPKRKRDPAAERRVATAAAASRVAIESIEPAVDQGRFATKRVVGQRVTVEADIVVDGHGKLGAALQWRAGDERDWRESPMRPAGNDRWSASFLLERIGPYLFRVVAWPDRFETWRDEVGKKHAAGLDVALELKEGMLLLEAIAEAAPGTLDPLLATLQPKKRRKTADHLALLTSDPTAAAVARADTRPGQTTGAEFPVQADRRAAEFASWYELFPRNQSGDPARHGTFRDVIARLPAIRDMGFDVLYLPPIHPIGRINRKGRDNTLLPPGTPASDDPGSPYAIGAAEGGHDAIHPELGTVDDFRALRDAAAEHGLELALDFAIQCSPDHPWLREHPEWFDWRPDGGLRYAENPPKKYEDIVNVDFYRPGAVPGLWLALRDIVAYWADEGVRIFRVDNPHTKPFAFWEWLIAEIRAKHPGTLFLAEAFTRPKVMYRLAKLGFSQSYTYFTWRNEKWEIEAYLRELTADAATPAVARTAAVAAAAGTEKPTNVADFFRPNFFVNTPDINPTFLQRSGRAGFLIRAALATTLSGLWGMLQGFEFCEAPPLPGREEYASSDKYQIRTRAERAPGDIVDEITRLNLIRRANPALQSHRGLSFHQAWNDQMVWFRKANVDRSNVVLVAVSLDPFAPQTADVEVPLWEWGLGDDGALVVDDLMRGGSDVWVGKYRTIDLDPTTLPFSIWRARPREIS